MRPSPLLLLSPLLTAAVFAQQGGTLALAGLDPVELCQGREVEGEAELGFSHWLYKYRFVSEANLQAFRQDPERYAIQWGGACARMGPLSGRGSPDRFAVHDGRIYIFASDGCRDGFLQDPARFLPRDDQPPDASAELQKAGALLLARAVAAAGGKDAIAGWQTLQIERQSRARTEPGDRLDRYLLTTDRQRVRIDQSWGDYHYSTLLTPQGGNFVGNEGAVEPMHPTGARELQLHVLRQPLVLLRRLGDAETQLAAAGKQKVGDVELELLDAFCDGARTTLGIDADGRLVLLRYRGRGPQLWFGELQWTFSDFRPVGALLLAFHQDLSFDGRPQPDSSQQQQRIALDPELAADFFAPKRH